MGERRPSGTLLLSGGVSPVVESNQVCLSTATLRELYFTGVSDPLLLLVHYIYYTATVISVLIKIKD